ncbi:hypothetical protein BDN70DRAFT_551822 [Pholiota conissans]|uniref:Uncharacterized protein n=1 Tax=Pholiota conissans TaxID=109636 RepID=A0A9P5YMH2_9AGAR|nr:hypothetical protein BDN70DRAFT_551822 [Pholiota conissans]
MTQQDEKYQEKFANNSVTEDEKAQLKAASRSPSPEPEAYSRFSRPTPSSFKRAALLIFVGVLLWMAFQMRFNPLDAKRKPKVIHASRYSKEHKFRPAASPIITETLKDGRIRLRGALQTPTAMPTPVVKKTRKGKGKGRRTGKKKTAGKRQ